MCSLTVFFRDRVIDGDGELTVDCLCDGDKLVDGDKDNADFVDTLHQW